VTGRWVLALAVCAALGACAGGRATFQIWRSAANADPVERVLVVTRIGMTEELRDGVSDAFRDHLAACGVRAVVLHIGVLDLDPEQRVYEAMRQLQPSAVLSISTQSSQTTLYNGYAASTQDYHVRVVSARSRTVLWEGLMTWKLVSSWVTDLHATGAQFVDSILDALRGSVLARCRAG
jgi:hypothetical protein